MSTILQVKNLSISFKEKGQQKEVVSNLNFSLEIGKTLGMVGESGSGKSLSALAIMQLLPREAKTGNGTIEFNTYGQESINLLNVSKEEMRRFRGKRIGMVFQEPMTALNPVLRCGFQLVETLKIHFKYSSAEAKKVACQWFEKVQLADPERIFNSFPHEISGGQKQRVLLAMAMCCEPDILIADEPTTALDVTVQKEILTLIRSLQKDLHTAILFISHDLGVISQIADDILVLWKGKKIEQAPSEKFFRNPQTAYSKGLLACRPPLDVQLKRLPVIEDFTDTNGGKPVNIQEFISSLKRQSTYHSPPPSVPPILEAKNLEVWFPAKKSLLGKTTHWTKAVNQVSLSVFPGEIVGLVGESGCGKTTLGRSIMRLQPLKAGQLIFKGQNLSELDQKRRKAISQKIQIVFQDPYASLNPRLKIGEALEEPLLVHKRFATKKERRAKIATLVEQTGLKMEFLHRYPHEFSGGQRQRICIARALVLDPEFVIFDESVSALDVSVQAQILNLIKDLQASMGLACLFISHDLAVVKFISDRLLVMHQGQIVESGTPDVVYHQPQQAYTRKLIDAIPSIPWE